jgi:ubiquinone/menaquinone biosynthesis C-methylase UbiE
VTEGSRAGGAGASRAGAPGAGRAGPPGAGRAGAPGAGRAAGAGSLREAWEGEAEAWIRFSREPDAFAWEFNIPAFLELVPEPGRLTLDIGCGEGRIARELLKRGHAVIGVDASPTLVEAARSGEPPVDAINADAADLPLDDASADLAVAFMALQSVDDLEGAIEEAARVLEPKGRLCVAVVHPMNSLEEAPHYFTEHAYAESSAGFTFHDVHRPLSQYAAALSGAGFVIEELREPIPGPKLLKARPHAERWTRTPCFLHLRARKA